MPPLVSIGVPVYNEERFLSDALRSLMAQSYTNLEIIISDNASTDGTEQICRAMAAADPRIKYVRQEQNVGVAKNFYDVMYAAQGKYFMWASGHDLWSDNLIDEAVTMLETNQNARLAFATTHWIDANGEEFGKAWGWTDTRGMDAVARFFATFWGNMNPILGVFRLENLLKSRGIKLNIAGADLVVLSELVLQGDFVHATAAHWSRREFRHGEDYQQRMQRYRSGQFKISQTWLGKLFPVARLPFELIVTVLSAPISWGQKLGILLIFIPSLPVKYLSARQRKS